MKKFEKVELLKELCLLFGPSGCEDNVADFIENQIDGYCDSHKKDRLGNVIARLDQKSEGKPKIMVCAHMDEVGFMVNEITSEGYLKFGKIGGIDNQILCSKNVVFGDDKKRVKGVIMSMAIHHKKVEDELNVTKLDGMYVDIGTSSKEETQKLLEVGSFGTFDSEFFLFGKDSKYVKSKAIDDRLGCAVMIEVMRKLYNEKADVPYDVYFCFTVREEVGLSGAQVAAQTILPDYALILETTAVCDIADTKDSSRVATLGEGGAISLMDRSTIYNRDFVNYALKTAEEKGIKAQVKKYVSGGNDAGHIHKSGYGVKTIALSAPTRYLHSPACVAHIDDYFAMEDLVYSLLQNRF